MSTTIDYLQEYIKSKDNHPELIKDYFLKLTEEVGELSEAIRKNKIRIENSSVKGTLDEEIWDVIYYAIAIANCYDIDLEKAIKDKEKINAEKYNIDIIFQENK